MLKRIFYVTKSKKIFRCRYNSKVFLIMTHLLISTFFFCISIPSIHAFAGATTSSLLKDYGADIASLKETATTILPDAPTNDVFYLRYCLAYPDDNEKRKESLVSNLEWRTGKGKSICDAANVAIASAMSDTNSWNNEPVRESAPHASIINSYITSKQIITTTSSRGDLVYCIRAGKIDDVSLMSELTVEQMVDFFIYCKEINSQVADMRSLSTDQLVRVITANDLTGIQLIGGDKTFRTALSDASSKANGLYPELSGPTLLLNLPALVGTLVKVFTPLFPPAVRKKIKFESGVLNKGEELEDYVVGGKSRRKFETEIENLVYKDNEW